MSATLERPQNIVALEHGNNIRLYRARRRKELAATPPSQAKVEVAHLFRFPLENVEGMYVEDLIRWIPMMGPNKALRIMFGAGILTGGKKVGTLTERQRNAVAEALER